MFEDMKRSLRIGADRFASMMLGVSYVEVSLNGETRRILHAGEELELDCTCPADAKKEHVIVVKVV